VNCDLSEINKLFIGIEVGDGRLSEFRVHLVLELIIGMLDGGQVAFEAAVGKLPGMLLPLVAFCQQFDGQFEVTMTMAWEKVSTLFLAVVEVFRLFAMPVHI